MADEIPNRDAGRTLSDFDQKSARAEAKGLNRPDAENLAHLKRLPNRLHIMDLDGASSDETKLSAQFNPTEFEELVRADWARLKSPGMSHRHLQYLGAENVEISFTLVFDALSGGHTLDMIMRARRFLRSLCYPRKGSERTREGDAPRALFVWPEFLTMSCVVVDLAFKYERFDLSGACTRFSVKVKVEQVSVNNDRLYLEDVRALEDEP